MINVQFKIWNCNLIFRQYHNQRIAIELIEVDTGEPVAVATVNLPDYDLKQNEVAIKTYSENESMLEVLVDAGVISMPIQYVQSGFVTIPVCKLLISPYGDNKSNK